MLTKEMFVKKQDLSLLFSGFPICEKETVLNTKTKRNNEVKTNLECIFQNVAVKTMSWHHQGGRHFRPLLLKLCAQCPY